MKHTHKKVGIVFLFIPLFILIINFFTPLDFKKEQKAVSNPYIVEQGFEILEESITNYSIKVELNIIDNNEKDFDSFLETNNNKIDFTLTYTINQVVYNVADVGTYLESESEDNHYVFLVTNLIFNHEYNFVSIDNTNLAVGNSAAPIDENINIVEELNIPEENTNFFTKPNPYSPISDGLTIDYDSIDYHSIEFTLLVYGWSEQYKKELEVVLINSADAYVKYTAELIENEGNYYTYRINNLHDNQDYTLFSIIDPGFALNSGENVIYDEILFSDYQIDNNEATFHTPNQINKLYIIILMLTISFLISVGYLFSRILTLKKRQHHLKNE